jgi:Ferritin-like domain
MTHRVLAPSARSRRLLITGTGITALGLVAGCTTVTPATPRSTAVDDAALLNNLLGIEYEVIAAYDAALAGGALSASDTALAQAFQADHAKHAEALVRAVTRLQDKPVARRALEDYRFATDGLRQRDDALRFLVGFEQGLALAHLGAVPAFAEKNLAKGSAGILGVETMHWSALRLALGETPVPAPFLG